MKKILFIFLITLVPSFAFADVSIMLDVEAPSGTLYSNTLTVTPCPVTNDPATTTISAKCALEQAGLNPQWSNYGGDDWFLTAAGGASQDSSNNLYWGWWSNLSYGQEALNKYELQSNDSLLIALGVLPLRIDTPPTVTVGATTTVTVEEFGFDSNYDGIWNPSASTTVNVNGTTYETDTLGTIALMATSTDPLTLTASKSNFVSSILTLAPTDAVPSAPAPLVSSSGGGGGIEHSQMNIASAFAYLTSEQNVDGSFSSPILSDWAALAFAVTGPSSAEAALRQYLSTATPTMGSVTDYERHAMALEALGINPYSGTSVDYITPIVSAFDGTQIGDPSLDNDDIFALFPLLHAGYTTNDTLIQKTVAFILSRQASNGAWDASSDVTAAAVQALEQVNTLSAVSAALGNAEAYLHLQQQSNGGFGNSFTTSWVEQAITALNEPQTAWAPAGYFGTDYLAGLQQSDGGLEPLSTAAQTRVWATEYAIPATFEKTWSQLLQSFTKPSSGGGGSGIQAGTPLDATSTLSFIATSTLPIATSTPLAGIVSTSTPSVIVNATSTPVVPVRHYAKPKVIPEPAVPVLVDTQTAAVAGAPESSFFNRMWSAIATFLSNVL